MKTKIDTGKSEIAIQVKEISVDTLVKNQLVNHLATLPSGEYKINNGTLFQEELVLSLKDDNKRKDGVMISINDDEIVMTGFGKFCPLETIRPECGIKSVAQKFEIIDSFLREFSNKNKIVDDFAWNIDFAKKEHLRVHGDIKSIRDIQTNPELETPEGLKQAKDSLGQKVSQDNKTQDYS